MFLADEDITIEVLLDRANAISPIVISNVISAVIINGEKF